MKKTIQKILVVFVSFFALTIFTACEDEGPAEKVGEKIDNAVEETQENLEEAGDEIEETAEETGDKLEEAGDNLQNQ